MAVRKKLLVVQVAGLGWDLVSRRPPPRRLVFRPAETVFPAVTCTVQASFRTASLPRDHGMVANGIFFGDLRRISFWEQSAALVAGRRFWEELRGGGRRVGMMFWQQSLGEQVDLVVSPRPIHKHHGGMIQDCYTQPPDLYGFLQRRAGRPFNLRHYWGPMASARSSEWIVAATKAVMETPDLSPDLLLTYIPHMDYDLQRHGPESPQAETALQVVYRHMESLCARAEQTGYEVLFFGDYALESVTGKPVYPNRVLRGAGWFKVRAVQSGLYPDFFASTAFAMADHQVAHVFTADETTSRAARKELQELEGIGEILDRSAQQEAGLDLAHSGELVLVAKKGYWFAYPWWLEPAEAPDYAAHVDIHNKPGYDPCELFFGWPPLGITTDATRVRGTHGRRGDGTTVAWASTCEMEGEPKSLVDLARSVRALLS